MFSKQLKKTYVKNQREQNRSCHMDNL